MPRRWLDRVLVAAAVLLAAGIGVQAIASWLGGGAVPGSSAPATSTQPEVAQAAAPTATTHTLVQLHFSPETGFLRTCPLSRLRYEVQPGPVLRLSYLGPPCQPPYPELQAVVRDPQGTRVRRVPALDPVQASLLQQNVAGPQSLAAPLAEGLLRCRSGRPDDLRTTAQGEVLTGTIPCRGQR